MKVLKIIFALSLVLLCNADTKAQSNDVLILKDGSILKGTISEYIPDSALTIILMDGQMPCKIAHFFKKASIKQH